VLPGSTERIVEVGTIVHVHLGRGTRTSFGAMGA
jgi:hypothetical protein